MIEGFSQVYSFTKAVLDTWTGDSGIGVYYLGAAATNGGIHPYYIGCAVGEDGLSGRIREHLGKWDDVTNFQLRRCSTAAETIELEKQEIAKYKPKYNIQGV